MKLTKQQQKGACVHLGSKCFFAILYTWFACTSFYQYRAKTTTEGSVTLQGLKLFSFGRISLSIYHNQTFIDVNQIHV